MYYYWKGNHKVGDGRRSKVGSFGTKDGTVYGRLARYQLAWSCIPPFRSNEKSLRLAILASLQWDLNAQDKHSLSCYWQLLNESGMFANWCLSSCSSKLPQINYSVRTWHCHGDSHSLGKIILHSPQDDYLPLNYSHLEDFPAIDTNKIYQFTFSSTPKTMINYQLYQQSHQLPPCASPQKSQMDLTDGWAPPKAIKPWVISNKCAWQEL